MAYAKDILTKHLDARRWITHKNVDAMLPVMTLRDLWRKVHQSPWVSIETAVGNVQLGLLYRATPRALRRGQVNAALLRVGLKWTPETGLRLRSDSAPNTPRSSSRSRPPANQSRVVGCHLPMWRWRHRAWRNLGSPVGRPRGISGAPAPQLGVCPVVERPRHVHGTVEPSRGGQNWSRRR